MKEWSDGYEDLKAIPFSFAVEFNDGEPVSMYTDSEAEKVRFHFYGGAESDVNAV